MKLQTTAVLIGGTQAVTDAGEFTVVDASNHLRTYRIYCADLVYFATTPVDATAITTTTGAPLPAGQVEFVDVPKDHELHVLGTSSATFHYNEVQKLP